VATGTGGYTVALRRAAGTTGTPPANLAATSNNNLYYAATPSATNLIYVEGTTAATNAQQTLAGYQALVAARESNSVTEDVAFLSTTGSAADFLHVSALQTSVTEKGGTPISSVTTDFDGDVRNATTPDIGADEFVTVPTIAGLVPARNATNVPVSTTVAVSFTQPVSAATASTAQLRVFSSQRGGLLAGAYRGGGTITATFDPSSSLKPGETIFTTIQSQGQNFDGEPIVRSQVYQFTTAASGSGTGSFATGTEVSVGTRPYHIATADVDGDGDLDLLAATQGSNSVSIRLNNGMGGFTAGSSEVAVTNQASGLAVGDIDGDGDLDVLTNSFGTGSVSVRFNDGSGNFATGGREFTTASGGASITLADVDGDGDLDFVTANYNDGTGSTLSVRLNNGAGSFSGGSDIAVGAAPHQVIAGDIDADGDLDLVTANANGNSVSVLRNDGAGNFASSATLAVGILPLSVELGDLDNDGDLDLLVANAGSNTIAQFANNGGTFALLATVPANADPEFVHAADVDADGDLDVLIANRQASTVTVRYNSGNGGLAESRVFPVGRGPRSIVAADLDDDGDLDLLTGNYGYPAENNSVSVRLNEGGGPLPVELVSFTAQAEARAVQLRWTTTSEKDNDYFALERSEDGHTFSVVGTVAGHGTSGISHRYAYTDARLPAAARRLYYRLRQVDTKGNVSNSPVQIVFVSADARAAFTVHPTAIADALLRYTYSGVAAENAEISIYSLAGQRMVTQHVAALREGSLSVASLPLGWYIVRYTTATSSCTSRFLVQK
jgi:hypothetical protein